ncbi:putative membrane protein [Deinococcus peraridilitoris DSM 19664]|uniref:Putative membrane protein n=2 Tax=Deinococcus TaxID=1298 RepID=K9ZZL3_DEIPD|nr:putative membrane protein [Deinococcus peraridilitoris DSM 19664]
MYSRLGTRLIDMLHSFWFLPSLMVLLSALLAEGVITLDERLGYRTVDWLLLFRGSVESARALLGGIAASIFGVASTVFSITIAALSVASNQMGPRLMESFTRDWRNSASLGALLATVGYTFIILRYVQEQSAPGVAGFVPHLGVTLALLLTFISLGVLIFFIHHVATSINVGYVIRLVHDDLIRTLEQQTIPGECQDQLPAEPPPLVNAEGIVAPHSGYLQSADVRQLVRLAQRHDTVIRLLVRPGDFVRKGVPVALATAGPPKEITAAMTIGRARTTNQDVEYAVRKLVEVASRALSPGLNDPYTAMAVLDHLGDALCFLRDRGLSGGRHECDGQVRLFIPVPDFQGLVGTMFDLIRQYGKTHPAVMIRMIDVLTQACACLTDPTRRDVLRLHATLARDEALENTWAPYDRDAIERHYERFVRTFEERPGGSGGPRPVEQHQ